MLATKPAPGVTSVIAHRGASRVEAENTVAAFRRAAEMGADMVELDVRRSADGVLVVHHNPHLVDGRAVVTTPSKELPDHVPTLDEALTACLGMTVDVEVKNDPAEVGFEADRRVAADLVELVVARGDQDRVLVSSFDIGSIDVVRAAEPVLATGWLVHPLPSGYLSILTGRGYQALHPWWELVTPELVERCHAVGVAVNCWTCDDPETMVRLAEWGVDGICTNVPDIAIEALRCGR